MGRRAGDLRAGEEGMKGTETDCVAHPVNLVMMLLCEHGDDARRCKTRPTHS